MDRAERTWIFRGEVLDVSLLPACAAVAKEWENADQREALKTFVAMDALLTMPQRRWPKTRAELISSVHITGGTLWEVKAPARGTVITRILAFQARGFERQVLHVALVRQKKTQALPLEWAKLARERIGNAQGKGML